MRRSLGSSRTAFKDEGLQGKEATAPAHFSRVPSHSLQPKAAIHAGPQPRAVRSACCFSLNGDAYIAARAPLGAALAPFDARCRGLSNGTTERRP